MCPILGNVLGIWVLCSSFLNPTLPDSCHAASLLLLHCFLLLLGYRCQPGQGPKWQGSNTGRNLGPSRGIFGPSRAEAYIFQLWFAHLCPLLQRRQWHPTPVLLPGNSHGRRSLVDCSPWGHEESDMTERLHFHFSLSCIGEGNGNALQCSCLENPRDGGSLVGCRLWGHTESDTTEAT